MTDKDWAAVVGFAFVGLVGLLAVLANRKMGRVLNQFNSGSLISPEKAKNQYREAPSGRYYEIIVIGALMAAGSLVAIVL